ncbi:hypothetical protein BCR21_15190 [Enterococcus ureasiticus]|uniref:Uncharacterized protein n=1 Tax=Enterococcus ureasiticus TaxID=903984 RepID=A0A1E5GAF5_9ENTE|nr:hypothetical protein BCR21_15190 [Enterococcus ureasiticus]
MRTKIIASIINWRNFKKRNERKKEQEFIEQLQERFYSVQQQEHKIEEVLDTAMTITKSVQ